MFQKGLALLLCIICCLFEMFEPFLTCGTACFYLVYIFSTFIVSLLVYFHFQLSFSKFVFLNKTKKIMIYF